MDDSSTKALEQLAQRLREGAGREPAPEMQVRALFLIAAAIERLQIQLDDLNTSLQQLRS